MPGTPYNSMGMESFNDTPVINGTAYPTLTVDPKAYRFRILNAANDRFFNLSLYQAIDANGVLCDANNPNPAPESTGVACTEVALNPDEVAAALTDPAGVFPTPVVGTEGPDWIDIANEGGFLPAPVVVPGPSHYLGDRPDRVQRRQCRPALAADRSGRAARRDRGLLAVRRPDADPVQRRSGGLPGARPALRLLHRQPGPARHRRRAVDVARLRTQHPHHHADQGERWYRRTPFNLARAARPPSPTRRTARACSRAGRTRSSSVRAHTTRPTARSFQNNGP